MELDELRLAAAEQAREVSAGAAVEGLAHDAIPRAAERVEIEKLRNAREIVGRGIEQLDAASGFGLLVRHTAHVLRTRRERMDDGLERFQHVRRRGGAGLRLHLEAVVGPWIVAGGDHDAGLGLLSHRRVRERLRRRGGRREKYVDPVRRDDLRGSGREMLRRETAVVPDDDAAVGLAALLDPLRDSLRAHAHRVERVLLGDARAPPVGAEHDLHARTSALTWPRQ